MITRNAKLKMKALLPNRGQIEGLPVNPRKWSKEDLDRLAASMEATPELTEARGCVVVPHAGKYIILGGNMRYEAARRLGWQEIACSVLPEDTPPEKMREIVIKDNGKWGAWEMDRLANEWPTGSLKDWGVDIPFAEEAEDATGSGSSGSSGSCEKRERIIITYPEDMRGELEEILGREIGEKGTIKAEDLEI